MGRAVLQTRAHSSSRPGSGCLTQRPPPSRQSSLSVLPGAFLSPHKAPHAGQASLLHNNREAVYRAPGTEGDCGIFLYL